MFHVEHADCSSEKGSLARNPVAAWEPIRAKDRLPKDLVAKLVRVPGFTGFSPSGTSFSPGQRPSPLQSAKS